MMDERDMLYKDKMKRSGLNINEHSFMLRQYVRLKQKKGQMVTSVHEPLYYTVINVSGCSTTGGGLTDGTTICRDSRHLKLANAIMHENGATVGEKM